MENECSLYCCPKSGGILLQNSSFEKCVLSETRKHFLNASCLTFMCRFVCLSWAGSVCFPFSWEHCQCTMDAFFPISQTIAGGGSHSVHHVFLPVCSHCCSSIWSGTRPRVLASLGRACLLVTVIINPLLAVVLIRFMCCLYTCSSSSAITRCSHVRVWH